MIPKLLTKLQLGLIHLGDHKLRHKFQDCVSPMYHAAKFVKKSLERILRCRLT